jgi:hypothetical protein
VEPEVAASRTGARIGAPAVASRTRAALLIGLGLIDVGLLGGWLAAPAAIPGFPGWMALRAVIAVVAVAVVGFTGPAAGPRAPGDAPGATLTPPPVLMLALAVGAWCFALPIFGAAIACIVTTAPTAHERTASGNVWRLWPAPVRWDNPDLKVGPPARHDHPEEIAGDLLLFDRAHDGRRLQALLRAARLPLRFQVPLARQALGDSDDDVRLFAFSLIDRRRRDQERAVQLGRVALEQATTPSARARGHLRMAELAWESVYHGLPEGAACREALATALEQVDRALDLSAGQPSAHALRGRILLRLGEPAAAEDALRRALDLRHPAIKVLPHLAEGAFLRRRFDDVRAHLACLHALEDVEGPVLGRLRAVMEHWV